MHKQNRVSKDFIVEIENLLCQQSPVRSTVIHADLSNTQEEEPSSWILEVIHNYSQDLSVLLYRTDCLPIEVDVELSIRILDIRGRQFENRRNAYDVINRVEADQADACLVAEKMVRNEELVELEQFLRGKVRLSCRLDISYSGMLQSQENHYQGNNKKSLTFGTVEELHYIKVDPKVNLVERLMRSSKSFFSDFTQNIEKDNNLSCLISLHA